MSDAKTVISIVGCGYVGLTLAAVFANAGFTVYAIEINPKRLAAIKADRSFFYEEGANPLIKAGITSGRFIPTNPYDMAIPASDFVFSCVGTPDNPDGSSNLTYVFDAAKHAFDLMHNGSIFVQKSTVPVGTGAELEKLITASGKTIHYVSCPEFSRESTAIPDTLWFDRIIAGSTSHEAAWKVLDLHRLIEHKSTGIAKTAGLKPPQPTPDPRYMVVSRNSAELIKVTANAFLALKISFANSMAKLADETEADITEVMDGVGSDHRIGRSFLNAGRGYGGGCFPKDVSGLIRSAEECGVAMDIMRAATDVNESMPHYIITKARNVLGGSAAENTFKGKDVAVLGLSFKAGTSDVRRAPAVTIANTLNELGATVRAYDPEAMDEARPYLNASITLSSSIKNAIKQTDCIFVATDWPEFLAMDIPSIARVSGAQILVDCMNRLGKAKFAETTLHYVGVGRA